MGRSSNLSGASVALDLLPKDFFLSEPDREPISVHGPSAPATTPETALTALARMTLDTASAHVALGPLAAFADIAAPFGTPTQADGDLADLAAGRLPEALGRQLCALIGCQTVGSHKIYRMSLCLAGLNRSAEAHSVLALLDDGAAAHPTVLALRGYLSFQVGEAEVGRRALARAALAARGKSDLRGILHFTQHVLLVHQFGG
jgi:hypothetical protein